MLSVPFVTAPLAPQKEQAVGEGGSPWTRAGPHWTLCREITGAVIWPGSWADGVSKGESDLALVPCS